MSSQMVIASYRPSQLNFWFMLSMTLGFTLFMLVQIFTQAQLELEGAILLLAALGCLIGLRIFSRKRVRQIDLYKDRLELQSQTTSRTIRWQELSQLSVDYSSGPPIMCFLLLEPESGRSIRIYKSRQKASATSSSFDHLIEQIYALSHQERLASAIARYRSGQKVNFKLFQIDQQGISTAKASLAWSKIEALNSDSQHEVLGVMRYGDQRAWKVFIFHQLSNSDILGALIAAFHPRLVDQRAD